MAAPFYHPAAGYAVRTAFFAMAGSQRFSVDWEAENNRTDV